MVVHARYRGELALYRAAVAHTYEEGWCLRFVRTRYGIPFKTGIGTAWDALRDMAPSRRHSNIANPPRGYPFWWWAGIGQPGHVALSLGGGRVRSTDWPRAGQIGNTYIRDISIRWGMTPLGWGHDVNDRSVWAPGRPVVDHLGGYTAHSRHGLDGREPPARPRLPRHRE
jgi:hypothetical protein